MTRFETINELKTYFKPYELVDKITYDKYGNESWQFFHTDLLKSLLIIRKGLGKSITINDWYWGGHINWKGEREEYDERGIRHNISPIVKNKTTLYLSGHVLGMALDFDVKGMTAEEVRAWIVKNANLFPCKIRLEDGVTWCHLDVKETSTNPKVYLFNV